MPFNNGQTPKFILKKFKACFSEFRYSSSMGRANKNAAEFFDYGIYNVGLIGFADTPVMYAKPIGS